MSFANLGLCAELLAAIATQGYTEPTPIQAQAIPLILAGGDLLAGAQTGTGKTAAFALPIIQRLSETTPAEKRRKPRALVLVPTRELAAQVSEQMQSYGRRLSLRSTMIYGGVGIQAQVERLKRGVDIVVATPGRLLDHLERGSIDLSRIEFLVLDEADRMLDLGFIDAILAVAEELPGEEQTLLFSATYSQGIRDLADELLDQPQRIEVARKKITADAIDQIVYPVEKSRKRELLSHLIRKGEWQQVLVFVRTRFGANKLTDELLFDGIKAAALHSNKSQSVRTRTLAEFKRGELRVLVATDVAARGLDIERLPQVVNYDLPQIAADYVHRIGRTGRAGENGVAISFLSPEEQGLLKAIEALVKYAIPRQTAADFPEFAVWRGGQKAVKRAAEKARGKKAKKAGGKAMQAKAAKPAKAPVKAAARPAKAEAPAAPAKAAPTRRKSVKNEKPAPKVGRRRERTKG